MRLTWPLLAIAVLLAAPPARADDLSDAKRHFRSGTELYRRAQYREAITEFEAAYTARPSGVLRYNIAQCYEKLGDIPSALRNYHLYLRETPNAEDRATVEAAMANLEKRLQERGVQQLLVYSEPSGAQVEIDGKPRGNAPVAVELPPGEHQVEVSLEGYAPSRRTVHVAADKSLELSVALQRGGMAADLTHPSIGEAPSSSQGTAEATRPATGTATTAEGGTSHLYTWVAAGAAGAALAGGILFGLSAKHNSDTLRDGTQRNKSDATSLRDSAKSEALAANILYGVAGAAGATAVTLFFIEGKF